MWRPARGMRRTEGVASVAAEPAQDGGPQLDGQVAVAPGACWPGGLRASRASLAVRRLAGAVHRLHGAAEGALSLA